tara:strand:- start:19 stop:219 length:201 start_codon:yes stop_codon:yes gene_type:complete
MVLASSPYTVFRASDWRSAVAEPIGIGQGLRLAPKEYISKRNFHHKRRRGTSEKLASANHIQLAFA